MTAQQLEPSGDRMAGRSEPSELDAFTATLSHDLREPLRGIHYYASLLQTATPPDEVAAIGSRIMGL
jgi:signal transduction histidine kinase